MITIIQEDILTVKNLFVEFNTVHGVVSALNGVSFSIKKGEVVGIVGESGCGKSVTMLTVLKLLPQPPGKVLSGEACFKGQNMLTMPESEMNKIRGSKISIIFQNPNTALNPVFSIGQQMEKIVKTHHKQLSKKEIQEKILSTLELVELPNPRWVTNCYPHQLSGGMKQRIMIAISLLSNAELLIADEPTTALDVTIQAQILKLILNLKDKLGLSVIIITHDIGLAAQTCDTIIVMYAGMVVEEGPTRKVLDHPLHPYTKGLLECLPQKGVSIEDLNVIPGSVLDLINLPPGCLFGERCVQYFDLCSTMPEKIVMNSHKVTCHLYSGKEGGNC